jgi:hypothetical protein
MRTYLLIFILAHQAQLFPLADPSELEIKNGKKLEQLSRTKPRFCAKKIMKKSKQPANPLEISDIKPQ